MAGQLYPIAGSKIYIGSRVVGKSEVTAADFQGQVWTEIDGWASAGSMGDTQEVIEQTLINTSRVIKMKGTKNAGTMENTFAGNYFDPGQKKFKEAIDSCFPYAFKIDWGGDCAPSDTVTFTLDDEDPTLVNWTAHGFPAGQPIVLTNQGGALPTGFTANTVYYIVNPSTNSFELSATVGGIGIKASAAGSGTNTAEAPPAGQTDMFLGLALSGARQGGEANTPNLRTWSIAINSNIVEV